jgi:hypothetical protein
MEHPLKTKKSAKRIEVDAIGRSTSVGTRIYLARIHTGKRPFANWLKLR